MSNKFRLEFEKESGRFGSLNLTSYTQWLETQLEQSRSGEAELVGLIKPIIEKECSTCYRCDTHCEYYELTETLKKYGGTE